MKKLMIIALALILLVPAFAMADDTVDISGKYYLWAFNTDNYQDFNNKNDADNEAYFYSKLRIATSVKPADDVMVYWRMDVNEGVWGSATSGSWPWSRAYGGGNNVHFDYAWAKITKDFGSITVGHQYFGLGNSIALEGMAESIKLVVTPPNSPVAITGFYAKDSEGGAKTDTVGTQDTDIAGINVGFAADPVNVNFYAAERNDRKANNYNTLIGAQVTAKLGVVDLNAEFDFFGGEAKKVGPDTDYKGQQLFVQATMHPIENFMVAAQLVYAKGFTGKNEVQVTNMGDCGSFSPYDYGIMHTEFNPVRAAGLHPMDLGKNAGTRAVNFIFDFTVQEGVLIQGSLGWAQPDEDKNSPLEHALVFNLGATFDVATNTKFGVQYNRIAVSMDKGVKDDAADAFMAALYLNF